MQSSGRGAGILLIPLRRFLESFTKDNGLVPRAPAVQKYQTPSGFHVRCCRFLRAPNGWDFWKVEPSACWILNIATSRTTETLSSLAGQELRLHCHQSLIRGLLQADQPWLAGTGCFA